MFMAVASRIVSAFSSRWRAECAGCRVRRPEIGVTSVLMVSSVGDGGPRVVDRVGSVPIWPSADRESNEHRAPGCAGEETPGEFDKEARKPGSHGVGIATGHGPMGER